MALTYPAAFCFQNACDTATITTPGALASTPPQRLQDPHTSRRVRWEADTGYITIALAAAATIDTFGLFGLRALSSTGVDLTASIVSRIRVSLSDPSAQDGAVYDSGSAGGRVSPYYNGLVGLRDGSASARYARFDFSAAGAAYVEAGFVIIGLRNQVTTNFTFGAGDTPVDPSVITRARSQAVHVDPRNKYRTWTFNFQWLSETERMGWVEDMDQLCGTSQNVMMTRNCASANLGRDTMCGRLTKGAPTISRDGFIAGAPAYSKSYELEDRK